MSEQLIFDQAYLYDTRLAGISIPVKLQSGSAAIDVEAKLDTGSSNCVFKRDQGELLGINVDSGLPQLMRTVAGDFLTYAHEVTLIVLGMPRSSTNASGYYFSFFVI